MSKVTNDALTRSGAGCFIAVPIWQQWALKGWRLLGVERCVAVHTSLSHGLSLLTLAHCYERLCLSSQVLVVVVRFEDVTVVCCFGTPDFQCQKISC